MKRLNKLQEDLELGRLEGDEKTKAEEDLKWYAAVQGDYGCRLQGLKEGLAKEHEENKQKEQQEDEEEGDKTKQGKKEKGMTGLLETELMW